MAEMYSVAIKVLSQKGTCNAGHKVGDEWLVANNKIPEPNFASTNTMCLAAFLSLAPHIWTLMFGGSFPWETEPGVLTPVCPDPDNPVLFELRRM